MKRVQSFFNEFGKAKNEFIDVLKTLLFGGLGKEPVFRRQKPHSKPE